MVAALVKIFNWCLSGQFLLNSWIFWNQSWYGDVYYEPDWICKHSGPIQVRCTKCQLLALLLLFFRWLLYLDKHFDGCYPEGKATHAEPVYATVAAMCTCINPLIWKRKRFDINCKTTNKGLGLNANLSVPVGNRTCVFHAWLSTVFSCQGHVRFIIFKNATKRKKKKRKKEKKKKMVLLDCNPL